MPSDRPGQGGVPFCLINGSTLPSSIRQAWLGKWLPCPQRAQIKGRRSGIDAMQQVADIGCVRLADQRRRLDLRRVLKATQGRQKGGDRSARHRRWHGGDNVDTAGVKFESGFGAMMVHANGESQ